MKKMLAAVLLFVTVSAGATEFGDFVKSAAMSAEGASAFNLNGDKFAALYVPLRTIDWPIKNAVDGGVGAFAGSLNHPDALVSARLNVPQLVNGLFGTKFFVDNSHGPVLPTLFIGPALKAEFPINKWTWKQDTFLLVGIPFGSLF